MGCVQGTSRTSSPPRASRARDSDHAPARQTGGTRTMTAYPDESLPIQGRAAGQGDWQADRATIESARQGAHALLRDAAGTLNEVPSLRSRLHQLLATIALQQEGNQFFLPPEQFRQQLDVIRQDIDQYRRDHPTLHELQGRAAYAVAFHGQDFEESTQLPTSYEMGGFHGR